MQWRKRQEINRDGSSQQGGLVRQGKLTNRRNCLLKKYWQRKACQPGAASLWTRNSLEKCQWPLTEVQPVYLQTADLGRGRQKSWYLLPSVWCTFAACVSHPFLVFATGPSSKLQHLKYYRVTHLSPSQNTSGCLSLLYVSVFPLLFLFCYSFAPLMIQKIIKR